MISGIYTLDGVTYEYYAVNGIAYDTHDREITRVWAYPVQQAVIGADYCTTLYFSTSAQRDAYIAEHNYCDKLPRRKIPEVY